MQYSVKFSLKTIRSLKSKTANGRTNQKSKGKEALLEDSLRGLRMNLIRENSRQDKRNSFLPEILQTKEEDERKQNQQTTQD